MQAAEEQLGEVALFVEAWEKRDEVSGQRKRRGRARKRDGWMLHQQKPEPKAGDRLCSLFLDLKGFMKLLIAMVP